MIASALGAADGYNVASNIAFGITALLMIFSAIKVVTTSNVVHAALYLVLVLGGVAANFILLQAEFVAATQVLVYIGAIVVLLLFGVMLTRAPLGKSDDLSNHKAIPYSLFTALTLLVVMVGSMVYTFEDTKVAFTGPNTTEAVSDSIFGDYLIPFEVVSVLLLAALIGAIVLARRD